MPKTRPTNVATVQVGKSRNPAMTGPSAHDGESKEGNAKKTEKAIMKPEMIPKTTADALIRKPDAIALESPTANVAASAM